MSVLPGEPSKMPCRLVPTSFDAHDPELSGFPLPVDWRWSSCEEVFTELRPHGVMMRLPLFWQMEVPLFHACRAARAPIFPNDPENMPLGAAALESGGIDTVVTEARDAEVFASYLRAEGRVRPRNWFIVHRVGDEWNVPPHVEGARVAQEVHLMPGVPAFAQCAELVHARQSLYHAVVLPAAAPNLALGIAAAGICGCGKELYKKV